MQDMQGLQFFPYFGSLFVPPLGPSWVIGCIVISPFFRYLRDKNYDGYYYSKCQNLRRELCQAYDEAFKKYDVLIMPTIPKKASQFPSKNPSLTGKYIYICYLPVARSG